MKALVIAALVFSLLAVAGPAAGQSESEPTGGDHVTEDTGPTSARMKDPMGLMITIFWVLGFNDAVENQPVPWADIAVVWQLNSDWSTKLGFVTIGFLVYGLEGGVRWWILSSDFTPTLFANFGIAGSPFVISPLLSSVRGGLSVDYIDINGLQAGLEAGVGGAAALEFGLVPYWFLDFKFGFRF